MTPATGWRNGKIAASGQVLLAHRRSTLHATEPVLSGGPLVYSDTGTSSDVVRSFVDELM